MNRNYKVIWNRSLGCFTAVAEYAKARGKSSKSSVSSNATINTTSTLSSTRIFRITTIWLGLVTAGFSMQAIAVPCDASTEIKCGINATTGSLHGIAIGKNATVLGSQGIAIGGGSSGQNTTASGEQSIAIGANVVSSGASSIAIGGDDLDAASKTNYDGSISTGALNSGQVNTTFHEYAGRDLLESWDAYGHHTEASGAASIAMGAKARSAGNLATAMGTHSSAAGMASSAFGVASSATGQGALAVGAGANSSTQDGVALGSRSVANVASGALGFAPISASAADQSAIKATNSTNLGAVSIGSAKDGTRQIVNLAAGTNDSDAVNVAQLKGVSSVVDKGLDFTGDNSMTTVNRKLGDKLTVKGGATTALSANNIGVEATGPGTLTVKLAKDLTGLNSANIGGSVINTNGLRVGNSLVNQNGFTFLSTASPNDTVRLTDAGLHNGNKQITGVLSGGTTLTNAANIGDVNSTVAANKTKYYSVNSTGGTNDLNEGATGQNAMAMGRNSVASGSQAISIGSGASGQKTTASGEQSIAIGANTVSKGASSIAIGGDDLDAASKANLTGADSGSVNSGSVNATFKAYTGRNLVETPPYNVNTESGGAASIAIGAKALSQGALSTAIGVQSSTTGVASSAFGVGSSATTEGSVALGVGSVADVVGGAVGYVPTGASMASTNAINATQSGVRSGAVSVGNGTVGGNRQIVNLAAGTNDSDAVNVAQLKGGVSSVVGLGFGIKAADGKTVNKNLGQSVEIVGSNNNITTQENGGKIEVKLNNNLNLGTLGSVTTGNPLVGTTTVTGAGIVLTSAPGFFPPTLPSVTTINGKGLTILGGPSITTKGIDAGNKKITRIDAGVALTDAVNMGQLTGAAAGSRTEVKAGTNIVEVAKSVGDKGQDIYTVNAKGTTATAGSSAVTVDGSDVGGNITDYAIDLSQDTKDSLGKANNSVQYDSSARTRVTLGGAGTAPVTLTNVADGDISENSSDAVNGSQLFETNTKVNKGFGLKAADGQMVVKQLGEQVEVVGANTNITTKVIDGKIAVDLNNNLDLGKTGSVKMGTSSPFGLGLVTTVDRSGMNTGNALASTDVNGLGVFVNGPLGIPSTALTVDGLNIIGGPSVTRSGGIDAGNKRVTRVANGINATDAVNMGQLTGAAAGSRTEVKAGTNIADVEKTVGDKGQDIYTVNAKGSTVSSANSGALTVTPDIKDTNNITDYKVDLGADTKASLDSADSALQSVVTQIDGVAVKTITKTNNTANFLKGDNIVLTAQEGGIKVATAQDLLLNSVKMGNTIVSKDGMTIVAPTAARTVVLSGAGLNNGGNQIINVKAGEMGTDAVNVNQLNLANTIIDKGLNFGGDSGGDVNRKLGQKLIVKGGDTIDSDPATKNISVTANGEDTLTVRLAKDINLGNTGSVTTGDTQVNNAGITLYKGDNGLVVLTNNGLNNGNNKITNVAAGTLSTTSQDAVNGSQLFETNENIAKGIKFNLNGTTKTYALGEAIEVATDTNLTATAFGNGAKFGLADTIKIGGASPNAVSIDGMAGTVKGLSNTTFDANATYSGGQAATQEQLSGLQSGINNTFDKGISFGGDNAPKTIKRKLGDTIIIKGGVSDSAKLTDSNIGVIADDANTLTVKLAKDLTGLNSASFGSDVMLSTTGLRAGATVVDTGGVSFSGSAVSLNSSGLNNGGNKLTNIARGEADTDAVNVGQLNEVKQSAADANKGWNLSAQGANTSTVKPSDTVDLNNTDNNITVSKTAESNNVSFNLNKNIAVDSVKAGDATLNSDGLDIAGGPKFTKTTIDAAGNKIINVADGLVAFESKEAVNGGQLQEIITVIQSDAAVFATQMGAGLNFDADSGPVINKKAGSDPLSFKGGNNITTTAEGSSIKFDLNGNINIESVTTGNTTVNNSGVTIKNGPSMTAAGIYAGNAETAPSMTAAGINAAGTKVTNVADGMAPRDAVNYGQLEAVTRGLGGSINELGYKIGEVEDDANAGISAAMAMSSLPQAYIIGKPMIGGGIATFNGESAVAIGFSKMSNDGRWVMKLNGTADTQGNVGGAIGAGFHFD